MADWYSPHEVRDLLSREKPEICSNENAEWLTDHLNKAFEKGRQIGIGEASQIPERVWSPM